MKRIILSLLLITGISFGMLNPAIAEQKIALIDTAAVIAKSQQIQNIKKEQQAKMVELEKWVITAKSDVEKQQTKDGKEKLIKKYDEEFVKKQEALIKNYQTKLLAADKNISDTIAKYAQEKGYDVIFAKGAVLYGGNDITPDILKIVK